MPELPGREVKCTRTVEVVLDGYKDLIYKIPATDQAVFLGPEGFFSFLYKDGERHLINPRFVVQIRISADVETDMELKGT